MDLLTVDDMVVEAVDGTAPRQPDQLEVVGQSPIIYLSLTGQIKNITPLDCSLPIPVTDIFIFWGWWRWYIALAGNDLALNFAMTLKA